MSFSDDPQFIFQDENVLPEDSNKLLPGITTAKQFAKVRPTEELFYQFARALVGDGENREGRVAPRPLISCFPHLLSVTS